MRIAQIAPPWISIPPKNYGGTESVISNLVEELVRQEHDVTLFAPGDARTTARLVSFFSTSLLAKKGDWGTHLKAFYHLQRAIDQVRAGKFDIVHTHLSSGADLFPLTASLATPHVTTLHSHFPYDRNPDGRIAPEKGPHLAIEAAKRARVPLVLAGTIDRYVKSSVAYFHEQIEPQIDNKQIKYVGPVNMKRKVSLLSRARGFLNPIEWEEPFGMVMIEAMAVGCPVISFARGAAPEIVEHGKTGFLVQDLDEMVQAIPKIEEIDREATRQHVECQFSTQVMAEKYTQVYEKVIAMNKKAPGQRRKNVT
jgi:glycosyltransferase involved in cell wall biosynthesis